jgi:beta-phosphoglucomutase
LKSGLKVIALDFDGTLVESNQIKDSAFESIFSDWPEYTEKMMQWHFAHCAIERKEKFRYFVEEVLGLPGKNDLIEILTVRFEKLTRTAIVECPFVNGAEEFLEYIWNRVAVYLVSAAPQLDLDQIIKKRKLGKYFKDIYGAPIKKVEILEKIMLLEMTSVNEILFIGDSPADQQSANDVGVNFIGRFSDRILNNVDGNVFTDFFEIKRYMRNNYELHR